MKKSDFTGIDRKVVEDIKAPIEKFKVIGDFYAFCNERIEEIKAIEYNGRRYTTLEQRNTMLQEWFDYVLNENDAYTPSIAFMILSAITKELKSNDDTLPPVLNKGVLAQTVEQIQNEAIEQQNFKINFEKEYRTNLQKALMVDEIENIDNPKTGWIIIPSETQDPENFEANVRKLQELSHNNWCTKTLNARPYLSDGEFHIYMDNGKPALGCRFIGDKIQEIQSEQNNSRISTQYYDIVKEHIENYNLSNNAKKQVVELEHRKEYLNNFINNNFPNGIEQSSTQEILKAFGINCIKDSDGFLTISHYQAVHEYDVNNGKDSIIFSDLGINENKLFKKIRIIENDADFSASKITDLGNLQSIGGNANFSGSKITDLGNLQSIGGNANFNDSKVTKGKLEYIGSYDEKNNPVIKDYKLLCRKKYIADFLNKNFPNGIEKASSQEILEAWGIQCKKDSDGFLTISHYYPALEYKFNNERDCILFSDLGIDENKLFQKIKIIENDANFYSSRMYYEENDTNCSELQLTSLGHCQSIGGNADFSYSKVTDLGNLQSIGGNADFIGSKITDLGNLQSIGGDASFRSSQITDLGKLQSIGGNADFIGSKITDLGNLQSIGGSADFSHSKITRLGNLQSIGGNAIFSHSEITSLDNLESIGRSAIFSHSKIINLNKLQFIGDNANFSHSEITNYDASRSIDNFLDSEVIKLEKLQSINSDLNYSKIRNSINIDFSNSQITNLGNLQSINGNVNFSNSQITNLGNLQSISGNVVFSHSKITSLGKLRTLGGANFSYSDVTDLGNLQSIGGVIFSHSKITNLCNLQTLGGADFSHSDVIDLGNLQSISGNAIFNHSKITDLGNLQSIGGEAFFSDSPVIKLGKLEHIGKCYDDNSPIIGDYNLLCKKKYITAFLNKNFPNGIEQASTQEILEAWGISCKKDHDGFLIISHYQPTHKYNIINNWSYSITFPDLGIDENKLFEEIKVIENDANFNYWKQNDANFNEPQLTSLGNLQSIGGNAIIYGAKLTSLGNLQSIGGNASICGAKLTSLGNLQFIGGNASFGGDKLTSLGNLQSIGGNANFQASQITDLGNLQSIGGDADFSRSQITDLGNLQSIKGKARFDFDSKVTKGKLEYIGSYDHRTNPVIKDYKLLCRKKYIADFQNKNFPNGIEKASTQEILEVWGIKCKKDSDGFLIISHYHSVQEYNFNNEHGYILFSDLGINENKLFQEIKIIENDANFYSSRMYYEENDTNCSELQLTSLGHCQSIGGNAIFSGSKITSLGNLQSIGGNADFGGSKITSLGNLQFIGGNANFSGNILDEAKLTSLGNLQSIGGNADFSYSKITDLGNLQSIGGNANFSGDILGRAKLTSLGNLQSIGGNADFSYSKITDLGNLKSIKGKAIFCDSKVTKGKLEYIGSYDFVNSIVQEYLLLRRKKYITAFLNTNFPNGIEQASTQKILETCGIKCKKDSDEFLIISHYKACYDIQYFTFFDQSNNAEIIFAELKNIRDFSDDDELKIDSDVFLNKEKLLQKIETIKNDNFSASQNVQYNSAGNELGVTLSELGIDENKLFKEIKVIEKSANFNGSQLTDLGNLQSIRGHADFSYSQIKSLRNLQYIGGNFGNYFLQSNSNLMDLGKLQSIGGDADFGNLKVTSLGNLQSIGGNAIFSGSQLTDLGNLQSIGGNANFSGSQLTDLGNLQSIGGNANFMNSQITDLGNLQSIGRRPFFEHSQVKNLGKLEYIGGDVDFGDSPIKTLGNLKSIGGFALFSYSDVVDLGKLESIGGDVDYGYRLKPSDFDSIKIATKRERYIQELINKNFPNGIEQASTQEILEALGMKCKKDSDGFLILSHYQSVQEYNVNNDQDYFTVSDLGIDENKLFQEIKVIKKDANFRGSKITNLGKLQSIGGNADFLNSEITDLSNLQSIIGDANFQKSKITDLGNLKSIGRNALFQFSQITDLGNLKSIGGNAIFKRSNITNLGKLQFIGGVAVFSDSKITDLENLQSIKGTAVFSDSKITDLKNLQSIGENANFKKSQVTNLGKLQSIGGAIIIEESNLKQSDFDSIKTNWRLGNNYIMNEHEYINYLRSWGCDYSDDDIYIRLGFIKGIDYSYNQ